MSLENANLRDEITEALFGVLGPICDREESAGMAYSEFVALLLPALQVVVATAIAAINDPGIRVRLADRFGKDLHGVVDFRRSLIEKPQVLQ